MKGWSIRRHLLGSTLLLAFTMVCTGCGGGAKEAPGLAAGTERTFAGIEFVWCPPGTFIMGSPEDEKYRLADEETQHSVTLTQGFWLGKYELTQAEYERVMGKNPSDHKGGDYPVENVDWDDAVEFCRKLSQQSGATYRLPTEAEWEYACRAGTTTRFCAGDSKSDAARVAWYRPANIPDETWDDAVEFRHELSEQSGAGHRVPREAVLTTHAVGEKEPNAWGLYDMHGNVWEWCSDWYDYGNYSGRPDPDIDPRGPNVGSRRNPARICRGGSWWTVVRYCRSAQRGNYYPGARLDHLGFRLVREKD